MSDVKKKTVVDSSPKLLDPFGRCIDYLRLSVTDKCNMRCFYCLPKGFNDFETPEHWLTFDEIERVIAAFASMGVSRVRLTGGEPLLRKDISSLARRLADLPQLEDLSLSSNASLLDRHAHDLKLAGVSRLNISLDTLREDRFKKITNSSFKHTMAGLMAAKEAGFAPIKINMLAMKGVNDDEFEEMVEFCIRHDFTLRFIEVMPMGVSGQSAKNQYLDLGIVKKQLSEKFDLIPGMMPGGGPARYVRVKGTELRIGFITPISQHFCETCNRVRLSVDGTLYLCLGNDHTYALRPLLRSGISDDGLKEAIHDALALKPAEHHFTDEPEKIIRFMSTTGG